MSDDDKMVADALRGSWVHTFLPQSLWPFAQLARWERPIGWKLLMWPCWWAVMLAANFTTERFGTGDLTFEQNLEWIFSRILPLLLLMVAGAFVMRGAGCTYNDLVDQDIDDKVARTRSRPLPSGRVSQTHAIIFMALQLLIGLITLLQFNWATVITGLISVITIVVYPFMKRITWWPQLFLGLAFSWGALVGWTAVLGGILFELGAISALDTSIPAILLYLGSICWVIAYDTIYAHQDIEDDALVGVKSTARLFANNTKSALIVLYGAALVLWAVAFYLCEVNWPAWLGLAAGGAHLFWQIKRFNLGDPTLSLRLFKSNSGVGWLLFLGLVGSLLI